MSIASAIQAAQQKIANAYAAISSKGGTLPATQDLANMSTAINSMPTTNFTSLSVTPSTTAQTLTPSSPYNGFNQVDVSAVTSSIDANIAAENIKSGVSILGVNGSVTELNGETRTVSLTSFGQTFTPSAGKNAITSITVNPANLARTVNPSTTTQSISVPNGFSGNGTITVNPVTSAIDANIIAENIKKDVQILGVTGTYEGSGGGGGGSSILPVELFLGDLDADGNYTKPASSSVYNGNISVNGVKTVSNSYAFCCTLNAAYSTSRANARKINGTITFPDLEQATGANAFYYMCNGQDQLTAAYFPKLQKVDGTNTMRYMFQGCTSLAHVYFNALVGGNAVTSVSRMTDMLRSVTGCTVHFPSNLQTIISGAANITNGFNGTNTVILYDLPVSSYNLTVNVTGDKQNYFNSITIDDVEYMVWSSFSDYSMTVNLAAGQHSFTVDISGSGNTASPSSGTIDLTSGDATLNITVS